MLEALGVWCFGGLGYWAFGRGRSLASQALQGMHMCTHASIVAHSQSSTINIKDDNTTDIT